MNGQPFKPEGAFQGWIYSEIRNIKDDIKDIKDNHLASIYKKLERPSWLVCTIISLLSMVSTGFIVRMFMK